jgi:NAD(P)H-hydrate epimerase
MTNDTSSAGPRPLYSAAQVRALDRAAIESAGIPGYTLMSRAGESCWSCLRDSWPAARSIAVLCGTGNNGGDGFVVGRLALAAGWQVAVLQLGAADRVRGDAQLAREAFIAAGGTVAPFTPAALDAADVIVDALLGTGLRQPPQGEWRAAIEAINQARAPVLAVDIPSGLQADTGAVAGVAVRAACTVTFIGRKAGLYTGQGPDYAGTVIFADLEVPRTVYQQVAPMAELQAWPLPGVLDRRRARTAHKGQHGHVLVIGGDHGMPGAVRLAGEAALRSGAGLVTLATRPEHAALLAAACPELMSHAVTRARDLQPLLRRATVVVIGPGLGRSAWAQALLAVVLEARQPQVIDADALNLLAAAPCPADHRVLTPHPGEAARLLDLSVAAVQADRLRAAQTMAERYGGSVVLKGAGSVVSRATCLPVVCAGGNPGMATAGMGDVLSGVIAGLLAQGLEPPVAAVAGACLHGSAGDRAAAAGERGMSARDVIAELRGVLNHAGPGA